tara:strand:- start:390 stop:1763 length:1374 start_codon:yes stop_codon:yes gene_type:complete
MNKYLKNLIYIVPIPFVINFLSNLSSISHVNLQSLLLAFFPFIFLYYLGDEINKILNLNSISLSISIYLMGLFITNFIFLPIDKYFLSFSDIFVVYNLFIGLYCLYFSESKNKVLIIFIFIFLLRILFNLFGFNEFNYIEYNSDVPEFWLPTTEKIYDSDLYFSIQENIIQGYPLMIPHIFANLHYLFFGSSTYLFSFIIPNIFLYLNLFLIYESLQTKSVKLVTMITFISILINSDWLSYLFFNSLMGEVVVNYLFSVFLVNAYLNKNIGNQKIYYLFLGFLYFLKPFASFLFVFIGIFHYIKYKKNFILFFTFIGILVRRIYNSFNFFKPDSLKSQSSENIYLDIFLENFEKLFEFKLENISLIVKNEILIDRILFLFLMIYLIIKLVNINSENNFNILNILFFINAILVFYLYSTIWKEIELGSAYRYLFSFITIVFVDLQLSLDKLYKDLEKL